MLMANGFADIRIPDKIAGVSAGEKISRINFASVAIAKSNEPQGPTQHVYPKR